ncbi:hypothetical protein L1987_14673 [Smallanthus sonchifolius]|uniref:Uncharacterized protein n=1 Tax=Smallanthus sonchifolius TaxID=185202 RepID=A0ACB9J6Y3_9ASTR|nr:hypothetical protein L1987_14673 [Smallanthus sonchifolius]
MAAEGEVARWLVAVQDGVEEEEEEESVRKSRRHVFEDLQIVDDRIEGHRDEGRESICVPPKNALLLMRGRSDPMKIEGLTNGSWEPSVGRTDEEDEVVENEDLIEQHLVMPLENLEVVQEQVMILDQDQENVQQDDGNQDQENAQQDEANQDQEHDNLQRDEAIQDQEQDNMQQDEVGQDQEHNSVQQDEVGQDQEQDNGQYYEVGEGQEHNQTKEEESFYLVSLFEEIMNQDYEIQEYDEAHEEDDVVEIGAEESTTMTEFAEISETHEGNGVLERESEVKEERESEVLPECLLMMMYEPKLSMEVSKETWVCRTDFIQRQSSKRKPPVPVPVPAKPDGGDESSVSGAATVNDVMRVAGGGFPTALQQPARSSCTLPAAPSMAMVVEQKLAKAVGYEPFVLKRCKSEPMKTAASKLQPESCVLENRKLERLSRVAFSVGAAGLGF